MGGRRKVVKAFNTVGFNVMTNPKLPGQSALLFYCGYDDDAKSVVASLALSPDDGLEFAFQVIQRGGVRRQK